MMTGLITIKVRALMADGTMSNLGQFRLGSYINRAR